MKKSICLSEVNYMHNISWKSFLLSDIFEIKSTEEGIDKNKLNLNKKGEIPYVTRTEKNNGIDMFILPQKYGLTGIWCSMPVADFLATVVAMVVLWYYYNKLPLENKLKEVPYEDITAY